MLSIKNEILTFQQLVKTLKSFYGKKPIMHFELEKCTVDHVPKSLQAIFIAHDKTCRFLGLRIYGRNIITNNFFTIKKRRK